MRLTFPLLFLSSLLPLATPSSSPLTIAYHPLTSTSNPIPLAKLTFNSTHPHLSSISSFTPPPAITNEKDKDTLASIGLLSPGGKSLKAPTTVISLAALADETLPGHFRIQVWGGDGDDGVTENEVRGVSFSASPAVDEVSMTGTGKGGRKVPTVEVVGRAQAPRPVLNRPVVLREGKVAVEEVEKGFLQKYWWVFLGVAVLAMAGGGGDK